MSDRTPSVSHSYSIGAFDESAYRHQVMKHNDPAAIRMKARTPKVAPRMVPRLLPPSRRAPGSSFLGSALGGRDPVGVNGWEA